MPERREHAAKGTRRASDGDSFHGGHTPIVSVVRPGGGWIAGWVPVETATQLRGYANL
jgi:hypothetical protein